MKRIPVVVAAAVLVAAGIRGLHSQKREDAGYESYARYATEEDAVRRGEQLGLGEATLTGPPEVVAGAHAEIALRFTVGKAGMKTGGGIRLATAHGMGAEWGGNKLQTTDPAAENYLSWRTSTGATIQWTSHQGVRNPLFRRYHPWQNINEFKLTGPALAPGDWIEIKLAARMQLWDETAFTLKFYVDAFGDDDYLPLARNPQIRITAADPAEINVVAPSTGEVGRPAWVHVWVGDAYGNPVERYRGTVLLEADSGVSGLPAQYQFRAEDRGAHRFENVIFRKPGALRVRVREKSGKLAGESNPVLAEDTSAKEKLYWGDIHTHTMYSDGRGSPEETYDFGKRVSAIDFCAVTDHAFITTDRMWREIKETGNRYYQPGRFVTFLAYEWSGMTDVGGDHNVYTTDTDFPLIRSYSYYNYENLRMYHGPRKQANHVEDLFRLLADRYRDENVMAIPHYGGRHGNPEWHNPKLQRQIEIFSDHRRSEDWATTFLEKGYRVGVMASTDNHAGNAGYGVRRNAVTRGEEGEVFSRYSPAERGTSLVAAYATELTREGIFQALYHRHTYATTGSRIILDFRLDGRQMGSEVRVSKPPRITALVEGTARVRAIRVVKNGKVIHAVAPDSRAARLEYVDTSGDYAKKFYYIDVVQTDGEKAISSPVWTN
jgi:hypothetical protein